MALFTEINRLKADLDALRPLAPEQEQRVLQKFRLEWNYNSNAIEGNSLTLGETRSLLLHGLTAAGKPMRDHLDIKGHNEAVLWLEDFVRDERPLTEQFIRGMHEVLLGEAYSAPAQTASGQPTRKFIQPGQYKTSPNNVLTATGEMFYFASPEETPARMTDLVDWYRQEEAAPTMHPVALAAEFHYRFVRIHPFDDGNGRMSRLLMNLILLRYGYPMTVIKATDRNRYLAALSEADAGDPEPFLRFIIENVEASLQLMIRAAKGESIDEPNDLDKKLALLKLELQGELDAPDTVWTLDSQASFYHQLLQPWLNDLVYKSEKFDFAFVRRQYSIVLDGPGYVKEPILETKYSILQTLLSEIFTKNILLSRIRLIIRWEAFRQKGNAFDMNAVLTIIFHGVGFTMFSDINKESASTMHFDQAGVPNKILDTLYRNTYSIQVVEEQIEIITNQIYDFIATQKAKFDKKDGFNF